MKPEEMLTGIVLLVVLITVVVVMTHKENLFAAEEQFIVDSPQNSIKLVSGDLLLKWDGPFKSTRSRTAWEWIHDLVTGEKSGTKDLYRYSVEMKDVTLKYESMKALERAITIHPIISVKGVEVKNLMLNNDPTKHTFTLTPDMLKNGNTFTINNIKLLQPVDSYIRPKTLEIEKTSVIKDNAVLSLWEESDCFKDMYLKSDQLPDMMATCCTKEQCDWLGAVMMIPTNLRFAPGTITGRIIFNSPLKADINQGNNVVLSFGIQNTANLDWTRTDDINADDNMVVMIKGCLDQSNKPADIITKVFPADLDKIVRKDDIIFSSSFMPAYTCKVPGNFMDMSIVVFANCIISNTLNDGVPCSNSKSDVILLDEKFPYRD